MSPIFRVCVGGAPTGEVGGLEMLRNFAFPNSRTSRLVGLKATRNLVISPKIGTRDIIYGLSYSTYLQKTQLIMAPGDILKFRNFDYVDF